MHLLPFLSLCHQIEIFFLICLRSSNLSFLLHDLVNLELTSYLKTVNRIENGKTFQSCQRKQFTFKACYTIDCTPCIVMVYSIERKVSALIKKNDKHILYYHIVILMLIVLLVKEKRIYC